MPKNNLIFVSFAAEDAKYADLLRDQAKNANSLFDFVDLSVKEPWDEKWKTSCRAKIEGCDGFIALLGKRTWNSDGAKWEMKCAQELMIPTLGVHIHKDHKGAIPLEFAGKKVIEWTWDGIAEFIDSL